VNNLLTSARNRAINLARRLRRRPRAKLTRIITLAGRNDLPPNLNPRRVYQLGEPGKWAVMTCPCGRGHVIELNLAHPGRARWSVTADAAGAPSVRPSVDVQSEHRCHFWLQSGRIVWV
jgi:hypothetical protein